MASITFGQKVCDFMSGRWAARFDETSEEDANNDAAANAKAAPLKVADDEESHKSLNSLTASTSTTEAASLEEQTFPSESESEQCETPEHAVVAELTGGLLIDATGDKEDGDDRRLVRAERLKVCSGAAGCRAEGTRIFRREVGADGEDEEVKEVVDAPAAELLVDLRDSECEDPHHIPLVGSRLRHGAQIKGVFIMPGSGEAFCEVRAASWCSPSAGGVCGAAPTTGGTAIGAAAGEDVNLVPLDKIVLELRAFDKLKREKGDIQRQRQITSMLMAQQRQRFVQKMCCN